MYINVTACQCEKSHWDLTADRKNMPILCFDKIKLY